MQVLLSYYSGEWGKWEMWKWEMGKWEMGAYSAFLRHLCCSYGLWALSGALRGIVL